VIRYRIGDRTVSGDDSDLQAALLHAYSAKLRPLCMCVEPGRPMYVAHINDRYVLKRMPHSGGGHHPDCGSYEPPIELSGLGEVAGSAIHEDVETGATALKLDFSLSKRAGRTPPASTGEADTVRTDGSKLTLRGLLHYLWDESGLARWVPAMAGKRSWYVVRRALLDAAENKSAKSAPLGSLLFVPEAFSVDRKHDIERNRLARLAPLTAPSQGGGRKLMLLIGEVKELTPGRYGERLVVKHLPDMSFSLTADLFRRMEKRFAGELALWNADEGTHLVAVCTFGLGPTGLATVEELTLVLMSPNWLPVEHAHDLNLLRTLSMAGRRFTKGLRYNMDLDRPLATAVLTDTPDPVALYIVPGGASDAYTAALNELVDGSRIGAWIWSAGDGSMPELPRARPLVQPTNRSSQAEARA
jgi:hypothetical protein